MRDKPRFEILDGARAAITTKEETYGTPIENYDRVAAIMNVILQDKLVDDIRPADAVLIMCGVKLARLINRPDHTDSQIDLCGYSALLAEVAKDHSPRSGGSS